MSVPIEELCAELAGSIVREVRRDREALISNLSNEVNTAIPLEEVELRAKVKAIFDKAHLACLNVDMADL